MAPLAAADVKAASAAATSAAVDVESLTLRSSDSNCTTKYAYFTHRSVRNRH
jgi:hypothetical protein